MTARLNAQQRAVVRDKLLASAAGHFAELGLAGANINQISIDAGFARGTVYNYFESKTALFAAVVHEGTELAVARYRETEGLAEMNAIERLGALIAADVEVVRGHESFTRAFLAEVFNSKPDVKLAIEAAVRPFATALGEILRSGQRGGEVTTAFTVGQLMTIAMGLMTSMYAAQWRTSTPMFPWDKLAAQMHTVIATGLVAPGAAASRS